MTKLDVIGPRVNRRAQSPADGRRPVDDEAEVVGYEGDQHPEFRVETKINRPALNRPSPLVWKRPVHVEVREVGHNDTRGWVVLSYGPSSVLGVSAGPQP